MAYQLSTSPLVLCRTGWLVRFDGDGGEWAGYHKWVREHGDPHEAFNFRIAPNGSVYGFLQIKHEHDLNIRRLGAPPEAESLDGVTVVWCSQFQGDQGLVVHGWYKNATAYRRQRPRPDGVGYQTPVKYHFRANAADVHLLEVSERTFRIPQKGPGTIGRADQFYVDENAPDLGRRLRTYIADYEVRSTSSAELAGRFSLGGSAASRRIIEEAAIEHAKAFLRSTLKATSIVDRQKDNCGWDLEAKTRKGMLRVEVKGRSRDQPWVALTVNEYTAFKNAEMDADAATTYRLLTVQDARSNSPTIGCFGFVGDGWWCETTKRSLRPDIKQLAFVNLLD